MTPSPRLLLAGLLLTLAPAAARAQAADTASITVARDGAPDVRVGRETLHALPRVTVTQRAHGQAHRYAGVPLAAVLRAAGAWPAGDAGAGTTGERGNLRGAALAQVVVVSARDGYRAAFALAELDSATVATAPGGPVILADQMDGTPLPAADGPFRVVAPGDLRPARSVRQVTGIAVRAAR